MNILTVRKLHRVLFLLVNENTFGLDELVNLKRIFLKVLHLELLSGPLLSQFGELTILAPPLFELHFFLPLTCGYSLAANPIEGDVA